MFTLSGSAAAAEAIAATASSARANGALIGTEKKERERKGGRREREEN